MLSKGHDYERIAEKFLRLQGCRIKDRNYQIRRGEIDLIALDDQTIVFVEVRYRKSSKFGTAEETITRNKQSKIIITAKHYMTKFNLWSSNARFDVITIKPTIQGKIEINWLKNAFS